MDLAAIFLAIVGTMYFNVNYERYMRSFGLPLNRLDIIIGTIMIIIVIEVARRQLGWTLAGLASVALLYLIYGKYFPTVLAHAGFSWSIG